MFTINKDFVDGSSQGAGALLWPWMLLDGDVSSGLVFARDDKVQALGNIDGLVASVIAIYR